MGEEPSIGTPSSVRQIVTELAADFEATPVDTIEELVTGSFGELAAGAVDHDAGVVRQAPNLAGWKENDVPLGPMLSKALGGVTVYVDNDANVGTLAEHVRGAGRGAADVLGVWVGTGIGGGVILNGL